MVFGFLPLRRFLKPELFNAYIIKRIIAPGIRIVVSVTVAVAQRLPFGMPTKLRRLMIVITEQDLGYLAIREAEPWTTGSELAGLMLAGLVVIGLWRIFRARDGE